MTLTHTAAREEIDALLLLLYGSAPACIAHPKRQPFLRALARRLGYSSERVCAVYYGRKTVTIETIKKWRVACGYPV